MRRRNDGRGIFDNAEIFHGYSVSVAGACLGVYPALACETKLQLKKGKHSIPVYGPSGVRCGKENMRCVGIRFPLLL